MSEITFITDDDQKILCVPSIVKYSQVVQDMLADYHPQVVKTEFPVPFSSFGLSILRLVLLIYDQNPGQYSNNVFRCSLYMGINPSYLIRLLTIVDFLNIQILEKSLIYTITSNYPLMTIMKVPHLYQRYPTEFEYFDLYNHYPYSVDEYLMDHDNIITERVVNFSGLRLDNLKGFEKLIFLQEEIILDLSSNNLVDLAEIKGAHKDKIILIDARDNPLFFTTVSDLKTLGNLREMLCERHKISGKGTHDIRIWGGDHEARKIRRKQDEIETMKTDILLMGADEL